MPLLVPLAIALVVVLAASLMWTWARYLAHRAYATPAALVVGALAAAGVWLLVASDGPGAPVSATAGWVVLAASVVALVGGWVALATVAPAAVERRRR
ncbi:membrane associated rhomboid family serine protease [Agrococcus sp. UYP33]